MITLPERLTPQSEVFHKLVDGMMSEIRVASPGIIQSFDAEKQTVTVQIAIKEQINLDGKLSWKEIPVLLDVPIFMPRAGNFILTMPVVKDDECLVIFGDNGMDNWWQNGGTQQKWTNRRHDLSDGYALLGVWSQPRKLSNYSTSSAQLRTEDGNVYIEITKSEVKVKATSKVSIDATNVSVTATKASIDAASVVITAGKITLGASTTIDGHNFLTHKHSGVESGTSSTGIVV